MSFRQMEAITNSKENIRSVTSRASNQQSPGKLAMAFLLTVCGRGEEAARLINVRSDAHDAEGNLVIGVDGAQQNTLNVR